jgi:hypothetical protein
MPDRPPDPACPECGTTLTFVSTEISSGAFRTQAASMPQMAIHYYDCFGCQSSSESSRSLTTEATI